jgi:L-ornithine N5-monooxygenase
MRPHAIPLKGVELNRYHDVESENGQANGDASYGRKNKSLLEPPGHNDVQDLICVGFGPASLAVAIALHDALEAHDQSSLSSLHGRLPKVMFLEKQLQFSWHSGMLLEGARMQITFIKDMATLRNPRSSFTFLNYLHQKERLAQFTNVNTFLPQRIEFEDYLKWCATWFDDVVHYGHEVLFITPILCSKDDKAIKFFEVTSLNVHTNTLHTHRARHVVIAVGGHGTIPAPFPSHKRIIHSSQYSYMTPKILHDRTAAYRIAVIGSGQSAAEIFDTLHSAYPNSCTTLMVRGSALKPSDDSPFVNEIFDPERVDSFFAQPNELRKEGNKENRGTNYGVVRLELLERIYEKLYMQRVKYGNDESRWPHRIMTNTGVSAVDVDGETIRLALSHGVGGGNEANAEDGLDAMEVDFVIVATGYTRTKHEELLKPARQLMPGGDGQDRSWKVDRDYRVMFEKGTVSRDAGVWLQGCCEDTHGVGLRKR